MFDPLKNRQEHCIKVAGSGPGFGHSLVASGAHLTVATLVIETVNIQGHDYCYGAISLSQHRFRDTN